MDSKVELTCCPLTSTARRRSLHVSVAPISEDIFHRHLKYSRAAQRGSDLAKRLRWRVGRSAQAGIGAIWIGKVGMVEQVENLSAQHQVLAFANLELT